MRGYAVLPLQYCFFDFWQVWSQINISELCSFQTVFFFTPLMLLTLLKILTLQRQTVFACPWVLCYRCCPPVSSRQVSPCKGSSIPFLLCLPKPSVAWFLPNTPCPMFPPVCLVSLAYRSLFHSGLFCLCTLAVEFSVSASWVTSTLSSPVLQIRSFSWAFSVLLCKTSFFLLDLPEKYWKYKSGMKLSFLFNFFLLLFPPPLLPRLVRQCFLGS